jgi:probable phosphoglycerate mutase
MLVLLIRHGLTDTTGKRLTGRTPGIHLNEAGMRQAEELAQRLSRSRIDVIYSSPLERCAETAQPLAGGRGLQPKWDEGLLEVDYGDWSGRPLKELAKLPLWQRLRASPADVRFPAGEAIREAQARGMAAVERLQAAHAAGVVAAFTHGDLIRLVVAHFVGIHIDLYQRLHVAPASVTALVISDGPARLVHYNDLGQFEDFGAWLPRGRGRRNRPTAASSSTSGRRGPGR